MVQSGLKSITRCRRLVLTEIQVNGPLIAKHMFFDRERMPGAIHNNQLILSNDIVPSQLFEASERDRRRWLNGRALAPGQSVHRRECLCVRHRLHDTAIALTYLPEIGVGVP